MIDIIKLEYLKISCYLTLCLLCNFACFILLSAGSFQNQFRKFFHEYHQSVKQFGSRSGPTLCWACSGFQTVCKDYQQTRVVDIEDLTFMLMFY